MTGRRHVLASVLVGAGLIASVGAGSAAATPPPTPPPSTAETPPTSAAAAESAPPSTAVDLTITDAAILDAKVGWAVFVADNYSTPRVVPTPCPLVTTEMVDSTAGAAGLGVSVLPRTVRLYRDGTGAGIVGVACGPDLAASNDPSDSTSIVVEATVLDGQADFPQYASRFTGSNNTPVVQDPELGGQTVTRCRSDPFLCVAAWHGDGLIIAVRLDGPRTDDSEAQTLTVLRSLVSPVVTNLATGPT